LKQQLLQGLEDDHLGQISWAAVHLLGIDVLYVPPDTLSSSQLWMRVGIFCLLKHDEARKESWG
jgi:hypothetical protein